MLNDELDTTLNRLLSQWHDWSCSYQYGKGYPYLTEDGGWRAE